MDKATVARARCDPVYSCSTNVYTAFSLIRVFCLRVELRVPVYHEHKIKSGAAAKGISLELKTLGTVVYQRWPKSSEKFGVLSRIASF